jgi:hypothetical protein
MSEAILSESLMPILRQGSVTSLSVASGDENTDLTDSLVASRTRCYLKVHKIEMNRTRLLSSLYCEKIYLLNVEITRDRSP